jgi:gamma-glutamylputrescine oxidase
MTTSHWGRQHSFRAPDLTADVVIVGGGYAGLSTAYWLTEMRPDLKIIIVERSTIGSGASGRNAGFLTIGSASFYKALSLQWGTERTLSIKRFAEQSLELVNQHLLKLSPEIKSERTTSLTLFPSSTQLASWMSKEFVPEKFGFHWKSEQDLPGHLRDIFFGGFEAGPEFKVNPTHLLSSLRKLLEGRKVQFIENSSAFDLSAAGLRTELNTIRAKYVVLAMNAYLGQFHPAFQEAIIPRRAQMLAVELEDDLNCPQLYYDPLQRVYWRTTQEKILIIGGKRLLDKHGETGDFEKVSPLIQDALEDYLRRDLKLSYKVINRWSGTMGFTEHELPYVGKVSGPLETYVIAGFSGHGMGLGFHAGKDLAEQILENKSSFFGTFSETEFKL